MLRQLLLLAFVKALLFSTHCHGYSIDVDYDTDRSASASANAKSLLGGNGGFASSQALAEASGSSGLLPDSTSPLGGSAGASSRIVPYTEYIYPNDISGQSLVKCSKPGEFHYLNIQGQCSICACVQNYGILKPVCVNCNGCTYVDTGPLPLTPLLPDISSKLTSNSLQPPLYPNEFENKPKVYPLFRPFNEFSFSDSLSGESDLQFPEAMPEGDLHIPHYPNPEPLPQFHENVATPHLPYPDVSPEIIPFDTPYLHETYTPPLPQIEPLPDLAPIEIPSFPEFKPITNIVFPKIHINEPLTDIRLIQEPNLPQLPDIDYLSHFTHFPQPTLPQLPKIDTNFSVGHVPHYPFVELTPHIVPYPNILLPNLPHHLPDLHLPNLTLDRPLFIPKPVEIPKFEVPIIERIPEPVSPPPITLPTTEKTLPIVKEPFYFPRPLLPKNQPEILTKPELVPQPEVILQKPLPRPHTNETVLPWPPKEIGGSVSGNTNLGPLPGPHPHQSCRPYPTKQYFQHPWDECQVCLCQEFYSQGLVNVEVECYTKPSCCIELPSLRLRLKGSEAQEILTQNNHVVQNTGIASPRKLNVGTEYDILDKMCETKTLGVEFVHPLDNCRVCTCGVIGSIVYPVCKPSPDCTPSIPPLPLESIVYLEPECRYKEPNTKYQRDCQLCSCQPVFVYVVAACEPTGDCQFNPVGTDAEPNANPKLSQLLTGSSSLSNAIGKVLATQYPDQQFNAPNGYLGSLNNYASGNSLTLPGHLGSSYGLTNNDRFTSGLVSPNYYGSNNLQGPGNLNQGFLTNHNELEGSLVTSDFRLPYFLLPNQYGSYNNLPVFNEGLPLASQGGYQGVDSTSNNVVQGGLPSGNVRFLNEFAQSKSGSDDEEVNRQSGLQNGLTPFNNYGLNLYGYQGLGSNNGLNNLPSPYSYGSYQNYGSPNYNLPNNYNGEYYASDPISSRVISQPALQDDSNSDSIHQSPFLRILPADADYAAPQQLILNNSTTRTTPGSMDYITGPNYAYDELPKPSNVTSLKGIAVQSDEPMAKAKGKNENTSTTNDGKAVTDSDLKDQKKKKN